MAPSRGRVAAAGCRRVLDGGQIDRTAFRLLTESPVVAGADGAVFTTRLPRSLETVQFLRIVPLGPDGAEPPFDSCGIVAVAVPDSRGPVAPRIDGHVDPATGAATLRVVTDGFDRSALQRDEPGLFDPGVAGTEPPRFRIRRAVGPVADPVYARVLREGPMQILNSAATPAVFEATFIDDGGAGRGLEPFVRYVYWGRGSAAARTPDPRPESPCSTHRGASRAESGGQAAAPTATQPTVGAARPDAPAAQPSRPARRRHNHRPAGAGRCRGRGKTHHYRGGRAPIARLGDRTLPGRHLVPVARPRHPPGGGRTGVA